MRGDEAPHAGYVAANADPWPGAVAFFRSPSTSGYELNTIVAARPTLGTTGVGFWSGPLLAATRAMCCASRCEFGELASVTEEALLNGANFAAIENGDGEWELFQFQNGDAGRAGDLRSLGPAARHERHRARDARSRSRPARASFW